MAAILPPPMELLNTITEALPTRVAEPIQMITGQLLPTTPQDTLAAQPPKPLAVVNPNEAFQPSERVVTQPDFPWMKIVVPSLVIGGIFLLIASSRK